MFNICIWHFAPSNWVIGCIITCDGGSLCCNKRKQVQRVGQLFICVAKNNHNKCMSNVQLQTSVMWLRKPGIWAKACDGLGGRAESATSIQFVRIFHKDKHRETGRRGKLADRLCDWNFYARRRDLSPFNLLTYLHKHPHTHKYTHIAMLFIGPQIKHTHLQQKRKKESLLRIDGGGGAKFGGDKNRN